LGNANVGIPLVSFCALCTYQKEFLQGVPFFCFTGRFFSFSCLVKHKITQEERMEKNSRTNVPKSQSGSYRTQRESALQGIITPQMKIVAEKEKQSAESVRERVAAGSVVIPANRRHTNLDPEGVGQGLRTKINVNLGVSGDAHDYQRELQKTELALKYGAESIMDLSNYGATQTFRTQLIEKSTAMIGTVPVYDAIGYFEKELYDITADDFLQVVRAHAEAGVDFMTIHAGITKKAISSFRQQKRRMNIVSRGGSLLFAWMEMTGSENPFYEKYDELLDICREYDVTVSLGDALRPGCLADASDAGQFSELIELGILTQRAWEKGVQVIVEGPGHMAINEIAANVILEKKLCHNAPFYVLGPLVTDRAPGYDHITSAIGGAIAAAAGADFLCYVTPAEHLRLPDEQDVKDGIIAAKIAAHAADIAKGLPGSRTEDDAMAAARRKMNWNEIFRHAIDSEKAHAYFESTPPADRHTCSMCGKMCAVRTTNLILEGKKVELASATVSTKVKK
jgi:phosphomethylpyrimidine synthase